jgi:hypothetical protein
MEWWSSGAKSEERNPEDRGQRSEDRGQRTERTERGSRDQGRPLSELEVSTSRKPDYRTTRRRDDRESAFGAVIRHGGQTSAGAGV